MTDSVMHYDQSSNPKSKGQVNVSTRHMEMTSGDKQIPNYFWVEGVNPGDKSVRITVTHPGQEPQCYNCLCSGAGKEKACKSTNTPKVYQITRHNQFGLIASKPGSLLDFKFEATEVRGNVLFIGIGRIGLITPKLIEPLRVISGYSSQFT